MKDAARFENEVVTSFFSLSQVSMRERKGGPGQYLALMLTDKTGSLEGRMWEEFAETLVHCSEGCYVKVQGQVSKYKGKFQLTLSKMRSAADREIETADFVPTTAFDIDEMYAELMGYVDAFKNANLRELVHAFMDDEAIGPAFRVAPAPPPARRETRWYRK